MKSVIINVMIMIFNAKNMLYRRDAVIPEITRKGKFIYVMVFSEMLIFTGWILLIFSDVDFYRWAIWHAEFC